MPLIALAFEIAVSKLDFAVEALEIVSSRFPLLYQHWILAVFASSVASCKFVFAVFAVEVAFVRFVLAVFAVLVAFSKLDFAVFAVEVAATKSAVACSAAALLRQSCPLRFLLHPLQQ
mgnify:CR=1 FL=1